MAVFDVLLPVKNGMRYLAEALDSICRQSFRDWRLFVLDHGSSDGSLELAHSYAESDARVVVRAFPEAPGLSGLLNRGLELCDCKYVLRQDADDVSTLDRMEVLAGLFEADPELAVLGSLGDVIDAEGRTIGAIDMPTGRYGMAAGALFRTPLAHPTAALRLESLARLGARYGEDFLGAVPAERRLHVPGLAEDYFLFGQLALVTRCMNTDRGLVQYRWHGANVGAMHQVEQMRIALAISRYLAESLSILHGVARFDPAPFCNHGNHLFAIEGRSDFRAEYERMRSALTRVIPPCPELDRELAFRKVVAVRTRLVMAVRFGAFAARHAVRPTEWQTVRSWLLRRRDPVAHIVRAPDPIGAGATPEA